MKCLPLIVPALLLCVGGCNREPFPDICTLDKAHIPFGTTVRVRAVVIAVNFTTAITGRGCAKSIEFLVRDDNEWQRSHDPAELVDRINDAFKESERRNQTLVVEADLVLEISKLEPYPFKVENPPAGDAHIKGAKNFTLVPSPY